MSHTQTSLRPLSEQVLLITGAGGGIGRATAIAAAKAGALLALTDIQESAVNNVAAEIRAMGEVAVAFKADISREQDVKSVVDATVSEFGRLNCAFNNAGIAQWQVGAAGKKLGELDASHWDRILAVNLTGMWLCMKAELEQMQRQGGGVIVNTASIAGLKGMARSGAYVASKHAVIGLSKSAAIEYAEHGIRVNCVCPGFTDTPFLQAAMAAAGPRILESVPLRRLGLPEEVADMVIWLMSAPARYVTGVALPVDGGVMAA